MRLITSIRKPADTDIISRNTSGLETAGPGCDDAVAIAVAGIQKNLCRTTVAERMVETRAELPLRGDQVVCLGRDQAAWRRLRRSRFLHAESDAHAGAVSVEEAAARQVAARH